MEGQLLNITSQLLSLKDDKLSKGYDFEEQWVQTRLSLKPHAFWSKTKFFKNMHKDFSDLN